VSCYHDDMLANGSRTSRVRCPIEIVVLNCGVTARGGYSALGTGLPVANNFNVGLVITWPIFNSFLTSHQVAQTKLRRKAIDAQIENLRQRIIMEVGTAFPDWQASLQRIARADARLPHRTAKFDPASWPLCSAANAPSGSERHRERA
jgi:Outer membrane efflux protein